MGSSAPDECYSGKWVSRGLDRRKARPAKNTLQQIHIVRLVVDGNDPTRIHVDIFECHSRKIRSWRRACHHNKMLLTRPEDRPSHVAYQLSCPRRDVTPSTAGLWPSIQPDVCDGRLLCSSTHASSQSR